LLRDQPFEVQPLEAVEVVYILDTRRLDHSQARKAAEEDREHGAEF
jgi:hypothetical protein